jgi:hypothetical protein
MSPYETVEIHVESEGIAASERDQRMHHSRAKNAETLLFIPENRRACKAGIVDRA